MTDNFLINNASFSFYKDMATNPKIPFNPSALIFSLERLIFQLISLKSKSFWYFTDKLEKWIFLPLWTRQKL